MKRSNFDLTEAIVALSEQNQPFQIQVKLQFPQLSLQSSYQLYCIVQESLTNIHKHAQADRVTIESTIVTRGTILEICDNGKGFDLKDDRIWIQQNNTDVDVALELVAMGVPKSDIILGLHPPYKRPYTGYGVV